MKTALKFILPAVFAMSFLPAVASADGRWDKGGSRGHSGNRGYNYDRGNRYHSGGHGNHHYSGKSHYSGHGHGHYSGHGHGHYKHNHGSSFSFGLSLGSAGYYNDDYVGLSYSRGYYRAPVVVREYRPSRYYDCPPPVIYYPSSHVYRSAPRYYSSGSVYYYSR